MTGWRNSDFPEMDDEERDVPLEGAMLFGLALLAGLSIVAFVLIAAGLIIN